MLTTVCNCSVGSESGQTVSGVAGLGLKRGFPKDLRHGNRGAISYSDQKKQVSLEKVDTDAQLNRALQEKRQNLDAFTTDYARK